jgi:hypothetical protein
MFLSLLLAIVGLFDILICGLLLKAVVLFRSFPFKGVLFYNGLLDYSALKGDMNGLGTFFTGTIFSILLNDLTSLMYFTC